ncbi:MAG: YlbF family regulator [Blautia sp.]|nr:YlbF family regulator [Lachnoclostridium sp.]MCM1211167.1 YlbF family regulator [Blautia sp.]
MVSVVGEVTDKFVAQIKDTDIYREYDLQRAKLKKQPILFEKIKEYRRKNFELQKSAQGDELLDKMLAFEKEYEKFRENPLVDDYLQAELAFCRMIQEVNVQITAELDFE